METNSDYVLVPRAGLTKLIKNYVVASNAMLMFSYLAENKRLEIHLDTAEVCKLLNIRRAQLESLRRKGELKSFKIGGVRCYSAFDIAKAAELLHRPHRQTLIPTLKV